MSTKKRSVTKKKVEAKVEKTVSKADEGEDITYDDSTKKGLRWQPSKALKAAEQSRFVYVRSANLKTGDKDTSKISPLKSINANHKWYKMTHDTYVDAMEAYAAALKSKKTKKDPSSVVSKDIFETIAEPKNTDILYISAPALRLAGNKSDLRKVLNNSDVRSASGIKKGDVAGLIDNAISYENYLGDRFADYIKNLYDSYHYKEEHEVKLTVKGEKDLLNNIADAYYRADSKKITIYDSNGVKKSSESSKKKKAGGKTAPSLKDKYELIHSNDKKGAVLTLVSKDETKEREYIGFLSVNGYASRSSAKHGKYERVFAIKKESLTLPFAIKQINKRGWRYDEKSRLVAYVNPKFAEKNDPEKDLKAAAKDLGIKLGALKGKGIKTKSRSSGESTSTKKNKKRVVESDDEEEAREEEEEEEAASSAGEEEEEAKSESASEAESESEEEEETKKEEEESASEASESEEEEKPKEEETESEATSESEEEKPLTKPPPRSGSNPASPKPGSKTGGSAPASPSKSSRTSSGSSSKTSAASSASSASSKTSSAGSASRPSASTVEAEELAEESPVVPPTPSASVSGSPSKVAPSSSKAAGTPTKKARASTGAPPSTKTK